MIITFFVNHWLRRRNKKKQKETKRKNILLVSSHHPSMIQSLGATRDRQQYLSEVTGVVAWRMVKVARTRRVIISQSYSSLSTVTAPSSSTTDCSQCTCSAQCWRPAVLETKQNFITDSRLLCHDTTTLLINPGLQWTPVTTISCPHQQPRMIQCCRYLTSSHLSTMINRN